MGAVLRGQHFVGRRLAARMDVWQASLVQIRRTPRLNRTKLVEQPGGARWRGDPKQNDFRA